jgi:phage virion morphogenesis protein
MTITRIEGMAEVNRALDALVFAGGHLGPAMRAIAAVLADETEQNFAQQGRPGWAKHKYEYPNRVGGKILQSTGQLAASISTSHSATSARIGTNKVYGAIHQFGGQTRPHLIKPRNGKALKFGGGLGADGADADPIMRKGVNHPGSKIPARPYLPITAAGNLQPSATRQILNTILRHLDRAGRHGGFR